MLSRVNRTDPSVFVGILDDAIARNRNAGANVGLLVIHIDDFLRIVSSYSYQTGDKLVSVLAQRLREHARTKDTVVRIGDSKFAVIVDAIQNEGHLILAANKLSQVGQPEIVMDDATIDMSLQIGAAASNDSCDSASELLQQAETALLQAIDSGDPYALYSPGDQDRVRNVMGMQREIDTGLSRGEFEVYFQPKVTAHDWSPVGAEALLRWNSPTRGLVPPDSFIPLADQSHRIHSLTDFVLHSALRQLSHLSGNGAEFSLAINATPATLEHEEFLDGVTSAMGLWSIDRGDLIVEITEGAIIKNPEAAFYTMNALRNNGALISIDDFGTGYSSLSYFRDIPADELKIDRSFIMNLLQNQDNLKIVETILNLAHGFGLQVTAEGVEDEETANALAEMGCDHLQGYFFSRPLPRQDFVDWLRPRVDGDLPEEQ